jgi:hypothetical protein
VTGPDRAVLDGRVRAILEIVARAVRAFLDERLPASPAVPTSDPLLVLEELDNQWDAAARGWFEPGWRTIRGHGNELRDVRNRWAHPDDHPSGPMSPGDVARATDTARRLLTALAEARYREWVGGTGRRQLGPPRDQLRPETVQAVTAELDALVSLPSLTSQRAQLDSARKATQGVIDVGTATAATKEAQAAGRLIDALANAERAVELSSRGIYSLNLLAGVLRRLGWLQEAEGIARESIASVGLPGNVAGHVALAAILCDRGGPDELIEAVAICQRARASEPGNRFIVNVLERAQRLSGAQQVPPDDGNAADYEDAPF